MILIMKKFYYYYYVFDRGFGCGVSETDETGFNLSEVTKELRQRFGGTHTVSFWHEISSVEYEEMLKIIGENQK